MALEEWKRLARTHWIPLDKVAKYDPEVKAWIDPETGLALPWDQAIERRTELAEINRVGLLARTWGLTWEEAERLYEEFKTEVAPLPYEEREEKWEELFSP